MVTQKDKSFINKDIPSDEDLNHWKNEFALFFNNCRTQRNLSEYQVREESNKNISIPLQSKIEKGNGYTMDSFLKMLHFYGTKITLKDSTSNIVKIDFKK